jgi:hypothetical protein
VLNFIGQLNLSLPPPSPTQREVFFFFFFTRPSQLGLSYGWCTSISFVIFVLMQMTFSPALSREFRPYKPDPAPLLHICSAWEVLPNEVMMVGDSLKDDVSSLSLSLSELIL